MLRSREKKPPEFVIYFKDFFFLGAKSAFIYSRGADSFLCSVEEFARESYRDLGFDQGLHGEGAVVNTICGILFWDVLYETPVPDAFR